MSLTLDYSRDKLLTQVGIDTLKDRYLLEGEASPQDGFARAAVAFSDDEAHAQRIYDYASKHWFMFSTPILSNAPAKGKVARGMPISCFLNYVDDSLGGIGDHWVENIYLASRGGGIGGHWSDIRSDGADTSRGSQSNGIIPFIKVVDSEMSAVSQGKTRRGSYAAFLDISHPEVEEFINMRKPAGGDINRKALNIHHGINITDDFMEIIENAMNIEGYDDSWDLRKLLRLYLLRHYGKQFLRIVCKLVNHTSFTLIELMKRYLKHLKT